MRDPATLRARRRWEGLEPVHPWTFNEQIDCHRDIPLYRAQRKTLESRFKGRLWQSAGEKS